MKSSFWTPYISDHTIHAICWTLIHSLWIGLAIALLSGLVITVTKKSSAALRYNLLCGILVLFTLSVGVTFYLQIHTPATEGGAIKVGQFIDGQVTQNLIIVPTAAPHLSFVDRTVMFLNEYSNIIFMAWLLFFVLKSLKMAGGLLYIQRIRNYKVHEVSEEFKDKITVFADQIGINQAVRLMQSELVKVPVAVGWLKPVILLPMGIILQLSTEQLESILWHELAHIRRRDYLVNILQGLVETVFFFNPGLLWLSSLIRAEREACCDDVVLSRTNRKANYLEALLAFGNEDNGRMSLAMSIGSGNQLRDRLKRMIDKENKRLNMAEKVVLIAGLVVLSAFTGLPKTTHQAVKKLISVIAKKKDTTAAPKQAMLKQAFKNKQISLAEQTILNDTTKKADTTIRFYGVMFKDNDADLANCDMKARGTDGNMYHLIVADGKLTTLTINGDDINKDQLPEYQYLVKRIYQLMDQKRLVKMDNVEMARVKSPGARVNNNFKTGRRSYVDTTLVKPFYSVEGKPAVQFFKQRYADSAKIKAYYGDVNIKPWKVDSFSKERGVFVKGISPRAMKQLTLRKRVSDDTLSYAQHHERAMHVIADLVSDNVVPNTAAVKWFGLSNTEFIVNGKKQPDAMLQKYKTKYGIHENYGLYYGPVQMIGTGVFIDDEAREQHIMKMNAFKDMQSQRKKIMQPGMKQPWSVDTVLAAKQRSMFKIDNKFRAFTTSSLNDMIASVTNDLVSENVVKDKSDLTSFKLTNSFLLVNGKQQPEGIHEKLRDKYLGSPKYIINRPAMNDPHYGLQYNAKTGSMGMGISIDPGDPAVK